MAKSKLVYLTGDKELDRQLRTLGDLATKKLFRRATRSGAKKMQAAIKATIPVSEKQKRRAGKESTDKAGRVTGKSGSPGDLKRSVKVRANKRSRTGRIGHSVVIGGDAAAYVSKVELGTRKMRPKRTIRDAFNTNKSSIGSQFVNDVWAEIRAEVPRT